MHLSAGALPGCEVQGRGRGARMLRKGASASSRARAGRPWLRFANGSAAWRAGGGHRWSGCWARRRRGTGCCPGTPDLADPGFRDALAAALSSSSSGKTPRCLPCAFRPVIRARPAGCLRAAGAAREIGAHASESRCRLSRIEPAVALVWARFQAQLREERGTLLLIDGERQLVVRHDREQIGHVALRPFGIEAPAASAAGDEALRVFSSHPVDAAVAAPAAALVLADGQAGFTAAEDARLRVRVVRSVLMAMGMDFAQRSTWRRTSVVVLLLGAIGCAPAPPHLCTAYRASQIEAQQRVAVKPARSGGQPGPAGGNDRVAGLQRPWQAMLNALQTAITPPPPPRVQPDPLRSGLAHCRAGGQQPGLPRFRAAAAGRCVLASGRAAVGVATARSRRGRQAGELFCSPWNGGSDERRPTARRRSHRSRRRKHSHACSWLRAWQMPSAVPGGRCAVRGRTRRGWCSQAPLP